MAENRGALRQVMGTEAGADRNPSDAGCSSCRYSLLAVFAATDGGITRVFPNK